MKEEYGVSIDVFLKVIYDAFSHRWKDKTPANKYVSSLKQTYDWCCRNWDLVATSVDSLKSTDLEAIVKEQCLQYLPNNVVFPDLTVYFVFNGCDGRGFKSEIYMDITLCAILGKEKCVSLLAHEYHHSCRANFALRCSNPKWKNAFETLSCLESEGVADKIYNLGGVLPDNDYPPLRQLIKKRKEIYENAPKHLAEVEKGILTDVAPRKTFSEGSNHPLGNYMADLIERRFGRTLLVDCVGDPLKFLKTYNEAAKQEKRDEAGIFVFSKVVIYKLGQIMEDL
ncbi:hypothetical protein IBX38_07165 [Candidatus Bathyarchaeota archaeon]|nr:hypothetical protein [Candidatus Bathyarchaeota archaeon]